MEGAPATRTPEVPGKRAAVDSGRGSRSRGGKSQSHRKRRKGETVSTEGLPCLSERLEYREQQRIARDEKLARRAQENADDQKVKDRPSDKSCSGRRGSIGGGCLSFVVHRSRRPSAEAVRIRIPGRTPTTTSEKTVRPSEVRVDTVCSPRCMRITPGRGCTCDDGRPLRCVS